MLKLLLDRRTTFTALSLLLFLVSLNIFANPAVIPQLKGNKQGVIETDKFDSSTLIVPGEPSTQLFVQLGAIFDGSEVNVKYFNEGSGWGLAYTRYTQDCIIFCDNYIYRTTAQSFSPEFNIFSVSKLINMPMKYGYLDAGIGLGVGQGSWFDNCEAVVTKSSGWVSFTNTSHWCDEVDDYQFGVPLQASMAFGKYIGIGLSFTAFVSKNFTEGRVLITIPLGDFTH